MRGRDDSGRSAAVGLLPWFMWCLGALFFGYGFFQRVAPSIMVGDLMRDFAVGAAILGNLSACYYYAYAGMQRPVGPLRLDERAQEHDGHGRGDRRPGALGHNGGGLWLARHLDTKKRR